MSDDGPTMTRSEDLAWAERRTRIGLRLLAVDVVARKGGREAFLGAAADAFDAEDAAFANEVERRERRAATPAEAQSEPGQPRPAHGKGGRNDERLTVRLSRHR